MANIDPQVASVAGRQLAYAAASAGGDDVQCGGNLVLVVRNAGGGPVNVTLVTPGSQQGLAVADEVVACPVGDTVIGPIDPTLFKDPVTHRAHVTYSAVAAITVACIAVNSL